MKKVLPVTLSLILTSVLIFSYSTVFANTQQEITEAIYKGDLMTLKGLVKSSEEANSLTADNTPILHYAAHRGESAIAKFLMQKGADILWTNAETSILHAACRSDLNWLVKAIIEQSKQSIDMADSNRQTPLMIASYSNSFNSLIVLLQAGAKGGINDALFYALDQGEWDTAELLLKAGASIPLMEEQYNSALLIAFEHNCSATADVLIKYGADINAPLIKDKTKLPPLFHYTIGYSNKMELLEHCIRNGADFTSALEFNPLLKATSRASSNYSSKETVKWKDLANLMISEAAKQNKLDTLLSSIKEVLDLTTKFHLNSITHHLLYYTQNNASIVIRLDGKELSPQQYVNHLQLQLSKENEDEETTNFDSLFEAIAHNDIAKIKALVKDEIPYHSAKKDLTTARKTYTDKRPLAHAIHSGNIDMVKYWMKLTNQTSVSKETHQISVDNNDLDMFKFLIKNDEDFKDEGQWLLYSILKESPVFIDHILKQGISADQYIFNGQSFLHYTTRGSSVETTNLFIQHSDTIPDDYKKLYRAIEQNNLAEVEKKAASIKNINRPLLAGITPLCWACYLGHYDMAELLIKLDADVDMQYRTPTHPIYGSSPLRWAIEKGHPEIVKLLLSKIEEPKIFLFNKDINPLQLATRQGNPAIIKMLLNSGFDPYEIGFISSSIHGNALEITAYYGHTEACQLLINNGISVNNKANTNRSPLQYAIDQNQLETARLLIKAGANINETINAYSLIHRAVRSQSPEMVRLIIANGVQIEDADPVLVDAVTLQSTAILKTLVEKGANVNARDSRGDTPLLHAIKSDKITDQNNKIKYLINAGANVNAQNKKGQSPLHQAIDQDKVALVQLLLKNGADINLKFKSNYRERGGEANAFDLVKSFETFKIMKDHALQKKG